MFIQAYLLSTQYNNIGLITLAMFGERQRERERERDRERESEC